MEKGSVNGRAIEGGLGVSKWVSIDVVWCCFWDGRFLFLNDGRCYYWYYRDIAKMLRFNLFFFFFPLILRGEKILE